MERKRKHKFDIGILIKKIVVIFGILIMLGATIMGATAFSIEGQDEYYITKGEYIETSLAIIDYEQGMIISSDSSWIDFDGDNQTTISSKKIIEGVAVIIPYTIEVPKYTRADYIDIPIVVSSGIQDKEFVVRVDVVSKLGKLYRDFLNIPNVMLYITIVFSILIFIGIILLIMSISGGRNKK